MVRVSLILFLVLVAVAYGQFGAAESNFESVRSEGFRVVRSPRDDGHHGGHDGGHGSAGHHGGDRHDGGHHDSGHHDGGHNNKGHSGGKHGSH